MHPWVIILSLILLLTDAAVSDVQIGGVVGQPVTLPCTYSAAREGVTSMCWGRGACPSFRCANELIYTDGTHVTYQQIRRYKLLGDLSSGDVSLTIEHASESDSGLYCCRIEIPGWFNDIKITLKLDIEPVPTSPSAAGTQSTTMPEKRTQPTSSPLYCCTTDGNGTVTQSSGSLWHNNQTQASPAQTSWTTAATGLYIGIAIFAVVLLAFVILMILKKYYYIKSKIQQVRLVAFKSPQIGTLKSTAEERVRAEDNVYIIEDNIYIVN